MSATTRASVRGIDRFVTLESQRFHYVEWESAGAPTLVMLHGGLSSAHGTWDETAADFTPRYRIIAVDQRGHGESDWDADAGYSVYQFATDTQRVLDTIGVGEFDLIGHSMGGSIALVLASMIPERVRSLVLVDSAPRLPQAEGGTVPRMGMADRPLSFTTRDDAEAYARTLMPDDAQDRSFDYGFVERGGTWTWRTDIAGLRRSPIARAPLWQAELWPHLASLRCPTLVLRSGKPLNISAEAVKRIGETNPAVRVSDYPQAGHWLHQAEPERFKQEILGFLSAVAQ